MKQGLTFDDAMKHVMNCFGRGDFAHGIALCTQRIGDSGERSQWLACRAFGYRLMENYAGAIADLDLAIKNEPGNAAYYRERAEAYFQSKQYNDAIRDCTVTIRLSPTNAQAYAIRGMSVVSLNRLKEGIGDLNEATRLDPTLIHAYSWRGQAKANLKDYYGAQLEFSEALRLCSTDSVSLIGMARVHKHECQYNEAIEYCQRAISCDQKQELAYYVLATVYFAIQKYEEAIRELTIATELVANNVKAINARAECYEAIGQYDRAQIDRSEVERILSGKSL